MRQIRNHAPITEIICGRKKKKKLPTPWRKVSQTGKLKKKKKNLFLLKKKVFYISLPS
jgi:hypothetical protein